MTYATTYISTLARLVRKHQDPAPGMPVYAEIEPAQNDQARIRVWADSVEEIVPKQFNYKISGTVCAEIMGEAMDESAATAALGQAITAAERVLLSMKKGDMLDDAGCAATLLDDVVATPQPVAFDDGRWRVVMAFRAYLQY